ncbi:DnaJ C-terminal domain-containing protein [Streptomonospora arabica]|uniref:DnaJ C-terminal domain-containing protein n=1 Tax=Streptomonospora arabica TaxID=412417 RepID=A0ABV9SKL1_9ACTN
MSSSEDPYTVLGVDRTASREEISRAFRALARSRHPDSPTGDRDSYARIRDAYEALSRSRADADGEAGAGPERGVSIPVRVRRPRPRRGRDAHAELRVDLAQAVYGGTASLHAAGGARLEVAVPPGTGDGARLRLRGRGSAGAHGGPPGDLVATVRVAAHPVFRRDGDDLRAPLVLGYAEMVLGTEARVAALDGSEITVAVCPGTMPGSTVRVPGRGVPARAPGASAGALLLEVTLDVPAGPLTGNQRAALHRLSGLLPPPRKAPRR